MGWEDAGRRQAGNLRGSISDNDQDFQSSLKPSCLLAAMHLGKTAAEAVEIACLFDPGCGNGVDVLTHG